MTLSEYARDMGLCKNPLNLTDEQIENITNKIHRDHNADMDVWSNMFQKDEIKYDEYKSRMDICLQRCFDELDKRLGEKGKIWTSTKKK
jgi:hypothetical protein